MFKLNQHDFWDFDGLVRAMPSGTFESPRRSTIPLLDFWRTPEPRLSELSAVIGAPILNNPALSFEYQVKVKKGRGKPSCTDLMIFDSETAIAIEAKFTEPEYESVAFWVDRASDGNREDVLGGWLEYIADVGVTLRREDVNDLPYQVVHRFAFTVLSSCSKPVPRLSGIPWDGAFLQQNFGSCSKACR